LHVRTMRPSMRSFSLCALVLAACGSGGGAVDAGFVIPATTKVLDDATRAAITSFDADGTLVGTAPALADLAPGDVIVSVPISGIAPDGFLRKVTSVTPSGGQVTVNTQFAALNEAITDGTITSSGDLPGSMVDMSRSTMDPTITIGPAPKTAFGRKLRAF